MKFAMLDTVVLTHDLSEHGLRAGDLGAVVEVYGEDGVEVEFVQASGQTMALLTLRASDLRSVGQSDVLAVRSA
jgi:hypothetical protein